MSHPEERPTGLWAEHPALLSLLPEQREKLIKCLGSNLGDERVALRCHTSLAIVREVRAARRAQIDAAAKRAWRAACRPPRAEDWTLLDMAKPLASLHTGSPELFLRRLRAVHRYGEGEPTRDTLRLFAALHSGKPEWSTADVARLRAPTLVRNSIAGDVAA